MPVDYYLPSVFQSSEIEPMPAELKHHLYFTKSPNRDSIL